MDIFIRDGGKPFFEKNYDGGLSKAAENFEDEINVTNKENEEEVHPWWQSGKKMELCPGRLNLEFVGSRIVLNSLLGEF